MNFYYLISATNSNVFFIRAHHEGKDCCFYMGRKGKHHNDRRDFHNTTFYHAKKLEWREKEQSLPEELLPFATKIANMFFFPSDSEKNPSSNLEENYNKKIPFRRFNQRHR